MKLRFSPTSPYVRKVVVTAAECGLEDRIEKIPTDTTQDADSLAEDNPLGKVPALVTGEGETLCDSPVICEYLDSLGGGKLFPAPGPARWKAINNAALADGIMDAAITCVMEVRLRPEDKRLPAVFTKQKGKIKRALARFESEAKAKAFDGPLDIGQIALGCALGYLDLRMADDRWRDNCPALAAWYEKFAARPSMKASEPTP